MKIENKTPTSLPFNLKIFSIPEGPPEILAGEGRKGALVVLPLADWATETHRLLIAKILQAVHLDPEKDVYVVGLRTGERISLQHWRQQDALRQVLAFGCRPAAIGLQIEASLYRPVELNDTQYLFAAPLAELSRDVNHKKALWAAMRQMFGLEK